MRPKMERQTKNVAKLKPAREVFPAKLYVLNYLMNFFNFLSGAKTGAYAGKLSRPANPLREIISHEE